MYQQNICDVKTTQMKLTNKIVQAETRGKTNKQTKNNDNRDKWHFSDLNFNLPAIIQLSQMHFFPFH